MFFGNPGFYLSPGSCSPRASLIGRTLHRVRVCVCLKLLLNWIFLYRSYRRICGILSRYDITLLWKLYSSYLCGQRVRMDCIWGLKSACGGAKWTGMDYTKHFNKCWGLRLAFIFYLWDFRKCFKNIIWRRAEVRNIKFQQQWRLNLCKTLILVSGNT